MIKFDMNFSEERIRVKPKIVILGIGGAGGNMLQSVSESGIMHVELVALNTDIQALETLQIENKIVLGESLTSGMGTGANPDVGKVAVEENIDQILEIIADSDIVFLLAGLGGGTGSGALPVLARILQEKQILSVALVTRPFFFEGGRRMQVAQTALQKIEEIVDTLIVIPNQKLFESENSENISLVAAFNRINSVVVDCVKAVTNTIFSPGHINVDFADIKTTMTRMGKAVIGIGKGNGEKRAFDAIQNALSCPLLEHNSLKGARSILLNIHGDDTLSLQEMNIIASYVHDEVHPEAHIIVGNSLKKGSGNDEVSLTIIATGFEDQLKSRLQNKNHLNYSQQYTYGMSSHGGFKDAQMKTGATQQLTHQGQPHTQNIQDKVSFDTHRYQEQFNKNVDIPTFFRNQSTIDKQ